MLMMMLLKRAKGRRTDYVRHTPNSYTRLYLLEIRKITPHQRINQ